MWFCDPVAKSHNETLTTFESKSQASPVDFRLLMLNLTSAQPAFCSLTEQGHVYIRLWSQLNGKTPAAKLN